MENLSIFLTLQDRIFYVLDEIEFSLRETGGSDAMSCWSMRDVVNMARMVQVLRDMRDRNPTTVLQLYRRTMFRKC